MADPTDYYSSLANIPNPVDSFYTGQLGAEQRQATAAQLQFQQQQNAASLAAAQLKAKAIQTAIQQPTQANYRAAALTDPDHAAGILGALGSLTDEQRKAEMMHAASVDGYLQGNQFDQAADLVQQKIVADQAAGLDTSDDQALLNLINTDPTTAKAHSGIALASLDPKTFAPNLAAVESAQKQTATLPGDVAAQAAGLAKTQADTALTNAQTQTTLHPPAKTEAVSGAFNPDGTPVLINPNAPPSANGAGTAPVSPGVQALVPKLIASESGGNPNATNPNSTAAGGGQFVDDTWRNLIATTRPDLVHGATAAQIKADPQLNAQVLALRTNPPPNEQNLSAQMVATYAQQNAQVLGNAGLPVNNATVAMAHKLGPGDAQTVLAAARDAPTTPLTQLLKPAVIAANPQLKGQTAASYTQGLINQFGSDPIQAGPADPQATGDDYLASLPPSRARLIKAIANGDAPMPTGRSAATGSGQVLMQQVLQYDPTASAVNLPVRQATRKAFTSGTQGQSITQANTIGGHLAALDSLSGGLNNTGIPAVNSAVQTVETGLGNADKQKAVTSFSTLLSTMAPELVKFYRNNGGSEADVQSFLKQLSPTNSPTQLHAAIQGIAGAVLSKIGALNDSYTAGMGLVDQGLNLPNVNHAAINNLIKLAGPGAPDFGGSGAPAAATQPAAPKIYQNAQGQKIAWDPASKTWKTVQ